MTTLDLSEAKTATAIQRDCVLLKVEREHNSVVLSAEGLGGRSSVVMSLGDVETVAAFLVAARRSEDFSATTSYFKEQLE